MKSRVNVSDADLNDAVDYITDNLAMRLNKHGRLSFIGDHESLGVITEEYLELIDAVKKNDRDLVKAELADIAVGCLFAIASIYASK